MQDKLKETRVLRLLILQSSLTTTRFDVLIFFKCPLLPCQVKKELAVKHQADATLGTFLLTSIPSGTEYTVTCYKVRWKGSDEGSRAEQAIVPLETKEETTTCSFTLEVR